MSARSAADSAQRPAPVNLIVGGDEFLAERRRIAITSQARRASGNPDLPVEMHKASEIEAPELWELLSPSLFADDRIIVISGIEAAGKETVQLIESAIQDPVDGVVLILLHKGGGRNAKLTSAWPKLGAVVHDAQELKGRERLSYIDREFRSHRVRVPQDVCELILDVVGTDLRELAAAVSQLVADTDGNVDKPAVLRYYSGKAEVSGFEVADHAILGNVGQAVYLTRRALQLGVPAIRVVSALSAGVRDVAKVVGAGHIAPRRDAALYKMAPWKLEKTVRAARAWTPAMVSRAVQIVATLDAATKGESADPDFALETAVRDIAQLVARR